MCGLRVKDPQLHRDVEVATYLGCKSVKPPGDILVMPGGRCGFSGVQQPYDAVAGQHGSDRVRTAAHQLPHRGRPGSVVAATHPNSPTTRNRGLLGWQVMQRFIGRAERLHSPGPGVVVPERRPQFLTGPGEKREVAVASPARLFAEVIGDVVGGPQRPQALQAVGKLVATALRIALPAPKPFLLEVDEFDRHRHQRRPIRVLAAPTLGLHEAHWKQYLDQFIDTGGICPKIGQHHRPDVNQSGHFAHELHQIRSDFPRSATPAQLLSGHVAPLFRDSGRRYPATAPARLVA